MPFSQVGMAQDAAGGTKFNQWFMSSPFAKMGVQRDGGAEKPSRPAITA
ncbi:hypothetical protein [Actinoallomurus soli]|nr:hypothetical protein [Actinoallomurus soli]MCO5974112.1 hypothetical protein [Actinoallomurus soli]